MGRLDIEVFFRLGFNEAGGIDFRGENPCEAISFSYTINDLPLKFGDVVDIAKALLPGYTFDRPQGNEEEWKQAKPLVSRDPEHKYSLKRESLDEYIIYFTTPLVIEEPVRKVSVELDKL